MNDIRALLRLAKRRIELSTFLQCAHTIAIVAGAMALALMFFDRALLEFVPWLWAGPGLAVVVLALATIFWSRRRRTEQQIALAVDEKLHLREKLTTAMYCQGRDDPFAQAAMEDGIRTARDEKTKERVRRTFSVTAPAGWWISPLLVLVTLMISFVHPQNLLRHADEDHSLELTNASHEVQKNVDVLLQDLQQSTQLRSELSSELDDLAGMNSTPDPKMTPEELRRDAIKKITDLNRKLENLLNGEKGKTAESLENAMSELKPPSEGPAKEFAEAMADGDFKAAKDALQELMDKIEKGELSEEQKKQLAEQMENLAKQLQEMAQQQNALKDALQKAGMDPELANNPQALQQQLQQNQNLNEEQKQQLQQMCQAQQQAQQMCQGMGQACQNMAQGLAQAGQGGQQGAGQGQQQAMGQMMQQLSEAEAMQQMLQEAQAAMNSSQQMCQSLGQNLSKQQLMQQWQQGGGFGNRGQGGGGKAPIAPTPTGTKKVKAPVKTTEGDIIARTLVDGPQRVGTSTKEITQVTLREVSDGYDQSVHEDELPRKYDEAMMHYFGELEKKVQAQQQEAAKESSETPAGETEASE